MITKVLSSSFPAGSVGQTALMGFWKAVKPLLKLVDDISRSKNAFIWSRDCINVSSKGNFFIFVKREALIFYRKIKTSVCRKYIITGVSVDILGERLPYANIIPLSSTSGPFT